MLAVGAVLRRARRRRGMTQRELAERAGIDAGAIRLLEGGHAEAMLSVWLEIGRVLGVALDALTGGGPVDRNSEPRSIARLPVM